MRNIKFRIYDTVNKCFISDTSNFWVNPSFTAMMEWRPEFDGQMTFDLNDSLIFQQYTGLKDKNGKDIYEGDILGYPESLDDKTLYEIRWAKAYSGEQWCEFRIQNINGDSIQDTEPYDYYGGISQNDYKIVVGNIFEGVDK